MISFRTKTDQVAAFFAITAIVIMVATLAWMVLIPMPNTTGIARGRARSEQKLQGEIDKAKAGTISLQAEVDPLLWSGTADQVGPEVLAEVNQFAHANKLQLVAFRPQKLVDSGNLKQIPFSISLDGSYPNAMQFVKDVENKRSRLIVSLVQVSAADAWSDHVSATVNIVAYVKSATASTTGGKNAAKS